MRIPSFLTAVLAALALLAAPALAQNVYNSLASPLGAHQAIPPGPTPTVSSCGTSPTISGNDEDGLITTGTGTPTSCTMTFAVPYNSTPYCSASWATNLASMVYAVTNTSITFTQTATSSTKITYSCIAQPGG
jgi:hypothetical protein